MRASLFVFLGRGFLALAALAVLLGYQAVAAPLDVIPNAPVQPLVASSVRLEEALRYVAARWRHDSARCLRNCQRAHTPELRRRFRRCWTLLPGGGEH